MAISNRIYRFLLISCQRDNRFFSMFCTSGKQESPTSEQASVVKIQIIFG